MENDARIGTGQEIIIYVRESQYNEIDQPSVDEQLAAAQAVARDLGYTTADDLTIVESCPNSLLARDGIAQLIGHIASGRAKAIVTYTLDRLGRPASEGIEALLRELRRRGVPLYIARMPGGYAYAPQTGKLIHDPAAVHEANMREWQPPEFIVIPRENEQDDLLVEQLPGMGRNAQPVNGQGS